MKDSNLRSPKAFDLQSNPVVHLGNFAYLILRWVLWGTIPRPIGYFTTLSCLSRLSLIVVVWTIPSSSSFSLGCFPSSLYTRPKDCSFCLARDCPCGSSPEFGKFSFIGFPITLLFSKANCSTD